MCKKAQTNKKYQIQIISSKLIVVDLGEDEMDEAIREFRFIIRIR